MSTSSKLTKRQEIDALKAEVRTLWDLVHALQARVYSKPVLAPNTQPWQPTTWPNTVPTWDWPREKTIVLTGGIATTGGDYGLTQTNTEE